jgi:chorismate dehydratase
MMSSSSGTGENAKFRIGAVSYLNARPLLVALKDIDPQLEVVLDYPSRLADALAAGRLDVAMIPSIEYARNPDYTIISDSCIACDGRVRSVKLYGRCPVEDIATLALDEGSRTSVALTKILLKERFGVTPRCQPLPIGASLKKTLADAVLLIGDRGMTLTSGAFEFIWDLGEEWSQWTGLPFVFSVWVARPGVDLHGLSQKLSAARDVGLTRLEEIARKEAPTIGIPVEDCLSYLRDHLVFRLGARQKRGLERFFELAGRDGLAPEGVKLKFYEETGK